MGFVNVLITAALDKENLQQVTSISPGIKLMLNPITFPLLRNQKIYKFFLTVFKLK